MKVRSLSLFIFYSQGFPDGMPRGAPIKRKADQLRPGDVPRGSRGQLLQAERLAGERARPAAAGHPAQREPQHHRHRRRAGVQQRLKL